MLILYAAPKYDYGDKEAGLSFEHQNFFDTLQSMGHDILYFDTLTHTATMGKDAAGDRLVNLVADFKPQLLFTVLFRDEMADRAIRQISFETDTVTYNWFCDDDYRFFGFTDKWAPLFNYVSTTAECALPWYRAAAIRNVIKTQWACNTNLYTPERVPARFDVTFVGQAHGCRRDIIDFLQSEGVDAHGFGTGWPGGRLAFREMLQVFHSSRINLNLANTPFPNSVSWIGRTSYAARVAMKTLQVGRTRASAVVDRQFRGNIENYGAQIKGRHFELAGLGAFQLSSAVSGLDGWLPSAEVPQFANKKKLLRIVKEFLRDSEARNRAAQRARERTLREHTYEHRFARIFQSMDLPVEGGAKPGIVEEI